MKLGYFVLPFFLFFHPFTLFSPYPFPCIFFFFSFFISFPVIFSLYPFHDFYPSDQSSFSLLFPLCSASYEVPLLLLNGISRLAASPIDIYRIESAGLRSETWVDQARCRRVAGDDGNVPPFPVNFLPGFLAMRRRVLIIFLCRVGVSKLNKACVFIRCRFLRLSETVPS